LWTRGQKSPEFPESGSFLPLSPQEESGLTMRDMTELTPIYPIRTPPPDESTVVKIGIACQQTKRQTPCGQTRCALSDAHSSAPGGGIPGERSDFRDCLRCGGLGRKPRVAMKTRIAYGGGQSVKEPFSTLVFVIQIPLFLYKRRTDTAWSSVFPRAIAIPGHTEGVPHEITLTISHESVSASQYGQGIQRYRQSREARDQIEITVGRTGHPSAGMCPTSCRGGRNRNPCRQWSPTLLVDFGTKGV